MEAIDSAGCRNPDIPFAILEQTGHTIARQAIRVSKVIRLVSLNAVDTSVQCPNPERVVPVYEQRRDLEATSIELRSDEWLPCPVRDLLKAPGVSGMHQPHPKRPTSSGRKR